MVPVAEGHQGSIESDVVAEMQGIDLVGKPLDVQFRHRHAEVGSLAIRNVWRLHLDQNIGRVVGKAERIIIIKVHSDDVAIPSDVLPEIFHLKCSKCLARVLSECLEATVLSVLWPRDASELSMGVCFGVNEHKRVDAQHHSDHHGNVEKVPAGQNDAKVAYLLRNDLVLERVESKHIGLLHVVEALRAFVHRLLGQADEERHHEHAQQAEHENREHCQQVAQEICLVSHDGEGNGVAVRALDLLGSVEYN